MLVIVILRNINRLYFVVRKVMKKLIFVYMYNFYDYIMIFIFICGCNDIFVERKGDEYDDC